MNLTGLNIIEVKTSSLILLFDCMQRKQKCRLLSIPAPIHPTEIQRPDHQPTTNPTTMLHLLIFNCTHSLVLNCLMLVTFRPGYLFIKMIWLAKTQTMKWCKNLFSNNIYISFLCMHRYYVEFISIVSIVYSQPRNRLWLWYQY